MMYALHTVQKGVDHDFRIIYHSYLVLSNSTAIFCRFGKNPEAIILLL